MNVPAVKPRVVLPPLFWLLVSIASFIAAVGVWQGQRIDRLRPPASAASAPLAGAPTDDAATAPGPSTQPASEGSAPGLTAAGAAAAPVRQPDPKAGRQVLRCTSKGRVTYRDLNAGCAEGSSERVTVFPTEGVGKPQ